MKRNVIILVVAIVALSALLAVGLSMLGFGFASQSQTDNTNNSMNVEYQVIASMKDGAGRDVMVQIPTVDFYLDGMYYAPQYKIRSTSVGTLYVTTPEVNGVPTEMNLRVVTQFKNALSWSLIESLDLRLNGVNYNLFDATLDYREGVGGDTSEIIPVRTGEYSFSLSVQYQSSVRMDPADFQGDKMESNVIFILDTIDPIDADVITITFNPGGGEGFMSDQVIDESRSYVKKCTFERENWTFAYWSDAEGERYGDQSNVYHLFEEGESTTMTLTAHWGKRISFYPNGGTNIMDDQIVSEDTKLIANTFERVGYNFAGWATSPSGSVAYADKADISMASIENDTKLYAVWTTINVTITYYSNTEVETTKVETINMNNKHLETIAELGFEKTGYNFEGWSETRLGEAQFSDGADASGLIGHVETESLYAIWGKKVLFDSNGGTGYMPPQDLFPGKVQLIGNMYHKGGHTFAGWATSPSGAVVYADKATITLGSFENGTKLYAVWTPVVTHVESVSLNITKETINVEGTLQLIATIYPDGAQNKNVSWISSNDAVATVDSNGLVTAVAAGEVTITVTSEDGSKTATCSVTVTTVSTP